MRVGEILLLSDDLGKEFVIRVTGWLCLALAVNADDCKSEARWTGIEIYFRLPWEPNIPNAEFPHGFRIGYRLPARLFCYLRGKV